MKDKKGQLGTLEGLIIGLVTIALVLVIGFLIMAQAQTQIGTVEGTACNTANPENDSSACNGTSAVVSSIDDIPAWLPIIIVVVIGSLLIGLIASFRRNKG